MRFAVNDDTGFVMNYEVIPAVLPRTTLFIHGNCASNRWWYPVAEVLKGQTRPTDTGDMILAEFRGCGQSTAPQRDSEVSMQQFAADFIALVDELNLAEPVNLVGHSTGGLIAALMLARRPELFDRAILLDPVGAQGVRFDDSMIAAFEQMKRSRELVSTVIGSTIHNNKSDSAFFQDVIVEDAHRSVKAVGHLVLQALDGLDVRAEMRKISRPTLVLHGEHDKLLPMEDTQALAALIPGARFEVIRHQGHCTNVEAPEKFVTIIHEFFAKA